MIWSEEDVDASKRILGRHRLPAESLDDISRALGRPVTYDGLKTAFRSRGLGSPGSWCARVDYADDEPPTVRRYPPLEGLESGIFYPDIHEPHSDEAACELAHEVSWHVDPDFVCVMGDAVDCHSISDHAKDPKRARFIKEEAAAGIRRLERIIQCAPRAKRFVYIEGNHEYRLTRYLQTRAPELDGCVTIRQLLRLDELGFEWVPYRSSTRWGKLNLTHECGNAGGQAHVKAMESFQGNVGIGHTHRLAIHYGGSVTGETHVGAMFGWLGSMDGIDYMHKSSARHWQHGIGVGYKEPNGTVHLQVVPFVHGKACVNGRLIGKAA